MNDGGEGIGEILIDVTSDIIPVNISSRLMSVSMDCLVGKQDFSK
jgi:hypothetical protein